jgi:hypothetical protein
VRHRRPGAAGFTADLRAVDGALQVATGEILWPWDPVTREVHRFEGVSDPDDTAVLYAIESASSSFLWGYGFGSSATSQPPPTAFTSNTLASMRRRRMSISLRWFVRVTVWAVMTCR